MRRKATYATSLLLLLFGGQLLAQPCATPTTVTATPATICVGASTNLNATSSGNNMAWYTVASGGTPFATVPSGTNVPVTPAGTTTYYVEAQSAGGGTGTQTFNFTGASQSFTVPSGITSINITARGARGGTCGNDASSCGQIGGLGGQATGTLAVTPGEVLIIMVGGQGQAGSVGGFNGGGLGCPNVSTCATGGGASDVRQGGSGLAQRRIVAAGGGGAEYSACNGTGGAGGGLTGNDGSEGGTANVKNGRGATQLAGGAGGTGTSNGFAGAFGVGGQSGDYPGNVGHCGGGGGGYYGGGGSAEDGHGGGGSSYIGGVSSGTTTAGVNAGDGQVVISWNQPPCVTSGRIPVTVTVNTPSTAPTSVSGITTLCSGTGTTLTVNGGSLGSGAAYNWYSASCGGTLVGTGSSITVTPGATTSYFVRASGACNTTTCASTTVNVSQAPTPAAAGPDQILCANTTSLAATPASVGTGTWSIISGTGGSFGNANQANTSFTAAPGVTYTLRWTTANGSCPNSTDDVVLSPDNIQPAITCPTNIATPMAPGQCSATVTYSVPVGTDNCPAPSTVQTGGLPSGGTYPGGVTTNTYRVTDFGGNAVTCSFTVTVTDIEQPVLTCPTSQTINNSPGACGANFSYTTPVGSDNCAGVTTTRLVGLSSGSFFPFGTTTTTYQATDAVGNTSSCSFDITVTDAETPVAVCNNITVLLDTTGTGSTTAAAIGLGSSDNCGIQSITASQTTFTCSDAGQNQVTLTVTDVNGLVSTCTATLNVVSAGINVAMTSPTTNCGFNITCAGGVDGQATATASGGCGSFTYAWSNGQSGPTATGLSAGNHTVTVTDASGGTSVQNILITSPDAMAATSTSTSTCEESTDGSVTVNATGGNNCQGYTYLWGDGQTGATATGLGVGNHYVTVTDGAGCTYWYMATVTAFPAPSPSFTVAGNLLTASQTWATYQWRLNGSDIPGATGSSWAASVTGVYTLVVTDANGCMGVSAGENVVGVGTMDQTSELVGLSLYPNPTKEHFYLRTEQPIGYEVSVKVMDLYGRLLSQRDMQSLVSEVRVDLESVAAGTYFVEVSTKRNERKIFKMVVQ